jgi:cellulose synthase/poly-beta-1,6-N-acetylglucosamine synthase-like glycosyltransferase
VGYVAAPSICDANAERSWAARGRLFKEASFHGPMQTGANQGWAPLCIGSHYAVRTAALRDIGGIGPELAEDFTTAFLLNAAGWQGAFALRAEAHGDGPPSVTAMLVQEFQWSRSLMTVLFDLVPRYFRRLPAQLRLRFAFALSYYPLLIGTTIIGILLPVAACLRGAPWVNVDYIGFVLRWWVLSLPLILMNLFVRRRQLLRPVDAKIFCWEIWLFTLARWPYVAWGVCSALIQKIRPRQITFKVTPKVHGFEPLAARLLSPYAAVTLLGSFASVVGFLNPITRGYAALSLLSATVYLVVSAALVALHVREGAGPQPRSVRACLRQVRTAAAVVMLQGVALLLAVGAILWTLLHLST